MPLGKGIYKTQLSGETNFEVVGTILLGVLIARRLFIRLYAQIRITQSPYCVDCQHILDQSRGSLTAALSSADGHPISFLAVSMETIYRNKLKVNETFAVKDEDLQALCTHRARSDK